MIHKCTICGRRLKLYKESNYSKGQVTSFAYSSRKIPEYMHWDLYECKSCRVLYSDCPIDINDIFSKYEGASYDSSEEADYASITYFNYLNKMLPEYPKNKALDIGTGNGSYLFMLSKAGVRKTIGIEPSKEPIKHANPAIKDKIINSPFRVGMFGNAEFDMVSLFQTIEHVPNSVKLFREVYRILSEGGYFYVICHNYLSFVNRIMGMKSPIYDIEHLQIFSKKSIIRLMKRAGFKDIKVFTIKNRYPLKYWIKLLPLPFISKKRMIHFFENSTAGNKLIGINVGNVGIIARKGLYDVQSLF